MGNAYLDKQKAKQDKIIRTAQDVAVQYTFDCMVSAMRENNRVSKTAILEIREIFDEKFEKFLVCFDPKHPEADYYRELLDRDQREVFREKAESFEERYPSAYDIRYDKPDRHKKKR